MSRGDGFFGRFRGRKRTFRQRAALDKFAKAGIIKAKSEPRTRLLLNSGLLNVAYGHTQPSLGRVAVVLFSLRFPYDNRHRILTNMKGKTHTHHPLSGGWSSRLRVCCSLSAPKGAFLLYRNCRFMSIVISVFGDGKGSYINGILDIFARSGIIKAKSEPRTRLLLRFGL